MKVIQTQKAPAAVGPYSQAIEVNGLIFTSGQLPIIPESGELINDDIKKATARSLENIKEILQVAGSSLDKVVKVNIFLKDMNDFSSVNEVYSEYFTTNKPARSCVEVSKLPKDGIIEIEAVAEK
ncbi:RidA family protein [Peptoniphilus lacrimalis]|uniref:Putative endoribonuclease L-PSP n=1 Tax=Peptoniphilus lacrimalis 315-B TaxID=596330 RepID=D1VUM9_9FIRM|nr:RidA family protein [Peptoniphilus lacrimalis]EFA89812.1 putative endoribonuclease L-PSP [Peptoniphilus lacrimalis 315-B]KGF29768.1 endoribonuclease L-PSP [Peptoniphilus lacrimalis DNF00528]MDK7721626.1 RidA family protein [Peptoniphilus lacrimalis]MDK7731228.1 RidA family protein [Peptoniphilus lacrimalis]